MPVGGVLVQVAHDLRGFILRQGGIALVTTENKQQTLGIYPLSGLSVHGCFSCCKSGKFGVEKPEYRIQQFEGNH